MDKGVAVALGPIRPDLTTIAPYERTVARHPAKTLLSGFGRFLKDGCHARSAERRSCDTCRFEYTSVVLRQTIELPLNQFRQAVGNLHMRRLEAARQMPLPTLLHEGAASQ